MQNANDETGSPTPGARCARLRVYQHPHNPTARDRAILTLIAEGHTQKQAAGHLGLKPRSVTGALSYMRDRYTAPTNEALIALALRLQWIEIAIEIDQGELSR
jgi:DNA-binding CsgD family transcriptional regulator